MVSNHAVFRVILLVVDHEEKVESGHNWRANVDILSESLRPIIAAKTRVCSSQN